MLRRQECQIQIMTTFWLQSEIGSKKLPCCCVDIKFNLLKVINGFLLK